MRKLLAAVLLALGAGGAAADPAADRIAQRLARTLADTPVLRAEFEQKKDMAAFSKPLVTRGNFVFARGTGVLWNIEAPLKLAYVISDERIVEIAADGKVQVKSGQDVRGLAQVGRLFRALLGAQSAELAENFDAAGSESGPAWRMELRPKSAQLAHYLKRIELSGAQYVEALRLEESAGDVSSIRFTRLRAATELDAGERERFALR
ncbi:MAG: outer membrane lipoprotein carrier protein LolA [Rhodocyclaceae bacterium]|nr:outer membrane lipoprotein carrier protein LolA [Rhodocyclaceae bacterium]